MSILEKYRMQEMHRSELKKCPYNPRKITAEAKRRLKAGLERFGLVQPLIFNLRSGTLIGGHQRLACLDDLHESKDYTLNMAVVDVDPATEKELVVFLNNASSQGFWDDTELIEIIKDADVTQDALGFSASEMDFFARMMKESEKADSTAMTYFKEIETTYDTLKESADANQEEEEEVKETRKEKWEREVSQFFEPAPPQKEVNKKKDEELTPEELKARQDFRASRENWKKTEVNDEEVILKILFTSGDNCRKWQQRIGLPGTTFVLHEKEMPELAPANEVT